jgi:hypothetical protein
MLRSVLEEIYVNMIGTLPKSQLKCIIIYYLVLIIIISDRHGLRSQVSRDSLTSLILNLGYKNVLVLPEAELFLLGRTLRSLPPKPPTTKRIFTRIPLPKPRLHTTPLTLQKTCGDLDSHYTTNHYKFIIIPVQPHFMTQDTSSLMNALY